MNLYVILMIAAAVLFVIGIVIGRMLQAKDAQTSHSEEIKAQKDTQPTEREKQQASYEDQFDRMLRYNGEECKTV